MTDVLLVVGDSGALTAGDTAIQSRLATTLGHTVTLINDETAEGTGYSLVVLAESCTSATIGTKYGASASPVLLLDGGVIDDWGLATSATNNFSNSAIDVNPGSDPDAIVLAAGLGLNTTFTNSTATGRQQSVANANLASGCVVVSTRDGAATATPHFYIETGGALTPSGTAANRRVFLGYRDNALDDGAGGLLTADGWTLFDAAVDWLAPAGPQTVSFNLITAAATVNGPAIVQTVALNAITASATVQSPTVTVGAVTVSFDLIAATATVNAPTVSQGAQSVDLNAVAAPSTVNAPTVSVGAVTVFLELVAAAAVVNSPTVTGGATAAATAHRSFTYRERGSFAWREGSR